MSKIIVLCIFLITIIGCSKKESLPIETFPVFPALGFPARVLSAPGLSSDGFEFIDDLRIEAEADGYSRAILPILINTGFSMNAMNGFIFINNLEIRADADRHSIVLGVINLHDEVNILDRVRISNLGSSKDLPRWDNWYKIRFNDIEGYIETNYVDSEKFLFNVNENKIVVYPRLANGLYWCTNPYCNVRHIPEYSVFINDREIYIPNFSYFGSFVRAEVYDGNLYLVYHVYPGVNCVIFISNGDELFMVIKNREKYEQYFINETGELDYLGEYSVPGQYRQGNFTIDSTGRLVAYWGTSRYITIPEKIAGITVRSTMEYENIFGYAESVRFPSTIEFLVVRQKV